MKKYIIFLSALLALSINVFPVSPIGIRSVKVTYVANSSFIVKAGTSKIMFNGLFQSGMNLFAEPDVHTAYLIKNALPPFDDIQLVLVSNKHAHQFDPYLATQFMKNNPEAKMICPQQAINKMKLFVEDFELVKDRIIESTPLVNHYDRFVIQDIEVLTAHAQVSRFENHSVENMAYVVNVGGVKFFHSGDSSIETLRRMNGLDIAGLKVDIAFLADRFGVGRSALQTNKLIDARYNVLMQFEKNISDRTLDAFASNSRLSSKPHIFKARGQSIDFYINDYHEYPTNSNSSILSQR